MTRTENRQRRQRIGAVGTTKNHGGAMYGRGGGWSVSRRTPTNRQRKTTCAVMSCSRRMVKMNEVSYLMSNGKSYLKARRVETARAWLAIGWHIVAVYRERRLLYLEDMAA